MNQQDWKDLGRSFQRNFNVLFICAVIGLFIGGALAISEWEFRAPALPMPTVTKTKKAPGRTETMRIVIPREERKNQQEKPPIRISSPDVGSESEEAPKPTARAKPKPAKTIPEYEPSPTPQEESEPSPPPPSPLPPVESPIPVPTESETPDDPETPAVPDFGDRSGSDDGMVSNSIQPSSSPGNGSPSP